MNKCTVLVSVNPLTATRTYYNPLLVADNGHFLYKEVTEDKVMMETTYNLKADQQFDQVYSL